MKRTLLIVSLFVIINSGFAQGDSTLSPSARFRIFPPAKFLLPDSVTFYTKADLPKNKQVMLMAFSPDCEHCQHETEQIIKHIERFKNIQILMSTLASIAEMKSFVAKYGLNQFQNIIVAKDVSYFLPTFYQFRNLPFLAFYDKKQKLISEFSGSLPVDRIMKEFEK